MSRLHWFPFYWEDYSTKTMHLTQAQHGAYMLLLRWIYTTGKPIPDKQKYSIAQARLKPELEATDTVLAEFFEENCGVWTNLRACEVMDEAADRHRTNSEKGRSGGLKRASNAQARLNHGSSNYNHNEIDKEERTTTDVVELGFEIFFKEAPRALNRKAAMTSYEAAILKASPETILAAVRQYAKQVHGFEERFILSPAKWLDDERWTDFGAAKKSLTPALDAERERQMNGKAQ